MALGYKFSVLPPEASSKESKTAAEPISDKSIQRRSDDNSCILANRIHCKYYFDVFVAFGSPSTRFTVITVSVFPSSASPSPSSTSTVSTAFELPLRANS